MISLRYHIVSLAAAFLALAVGVVLGATTLSGPLLSGLATDKSELTSQVADLEAERNGLQARLADADAFAESVGPEVVSDVLAQRSVMVLSTERVKPSERDALKRLIEQAGGKVSGQVELTDAFSSPSKTDQLTEIATRLQPSGAKFPTSGGPGSLAGALLGQVLLLDKETADPQSSSEELKAALAGLNDGGFIKATDDNIRPAQLAIVLTQGEAIGDGAGDKADTIARFATQLDRSGAGTVLAGDGDSASGSGPIGVVRADDAATETVSTVDNVDTSIGRIATILALREQLEGQSGRYGTAGNAQDSAPDVSSSGD